MFNMRIAFLTEIPRVINEVYKTYKLKSNNNFNNNSNNNSTNKY